MIAGTGTTVTTDTKCCQPGESPPQQHLVQLRGLRLGHRERQLLLSAPPSDAMIAGTTEGAYRIKESTRAAQVATHRAARKLADRGLVHLLHPLARELGVSIFRTDIGDAVVDVYADQLASGQRIRWPR